MPKFKIICFIVAAVLAAVGTVVVLRNLSSDYVPPTNTNVEDYNTYLDRTEDMDITDRSRDVTDFLFVAHKRLLSGSGFKGVSEGASTAVMGIKQNVLNTRYVVGDFANKSVFKEMVTTGAVSNAYQLYLVDASKNGSYVYRDSDRINGLRDVVWSSSATPLAWQQFMDSFGHRSDKLTGYILNRDTIAGGEFVGEENGLYTFRYILKTEEVSFNYPAEGGEVVTLQRGAAEKLCYEMVKNGGLENLPTFEKCEIYVTMDADFNIKSLRTDCRYVAQTMGINAGCSEDITETFEPYEGDLPYSDFFTPYLGQTGGSLDEKATPLGMLTGMFSPYLNGERLQAKLTVLNGDKAFTDAMVSIGGLDIADLSRLSVDLRLGDLNLNYLHGDGKILFNYGDFNASATISGVTELVGTFTALLGEPSTASATAATQDLDLLGLLNDLQYELSDDEQICTVTLPLSVAGLDINASLVGISNGSGYDFSYADITIGDVALHVELQSWSPAQIDANASEILGLADLIEDGKLSLTAKVEIPLFDRTYSVTADVLADLASKAVRAHAVLGSNGELDAVYIDGTAYLALGDNLKFKLDVSQTDKLQEIAENLTSKLGGGVLPDTNAAHLLTLFGGVDVLTDKNGVDLQFAIGEMRVTLRLADRGGRWQVEKITANGYGVDATVAPADSYGDVYAPADAEQYVDVTQLADAFDEAVLEALDAQGIGAKFDLQLTLGGKTYRAEGNVLRDAQGNVEATAAVYDDEVGILTANVVYYDQRIYLTVNGVKVAFAVSGGGIDAGVVDALGKLVSDERISRLLESDDDVSELVGTVGALVQKVKDFDVESLWDTDFTATVTRFLFDEGVLAVTLDGAALGFDGAQLSFDVYTEEGDLALRLYGLPVSADPQGTVRLVTDVPTVELPDAEEYVLTLRGTVFGATADVTLDLAKSDIWASVHIRNEELLVRFVGGKLYAAYGGIKIVLDVTDADTLGKLQSLMGDVGAPDVPVAEVAAMLAALKADFTGDSPALSLDGDAVKVSVNFTNTDGNLMFDGVNAEFTLNGEVYEATLACGDAPAFKLDTEQQFVDGNALVESLADTIATFRGGNAAIHAVLDFTSGSDAYCAEIFVDCGDVLRVRLILTDKAANVTLVSAEIIYIAQGAQGTLYIDVNGIRQAVSMTSLQQGGGESVLEQLAGIANEFRGVSDVTDDLFDVFDKLAQGAKDFVYSQFISNLYEEEGRYCLALDLRQIGLGTANVTFGLGSDPSVSVTGLSIGNISADVTAEVSISDAVVEEPSARDYVTEFTFRLGEMDGKARVDVYNRYACGELSLKDGSKLLFEYSDGAVYLQYGEISLTAKAADANELLKLIGKFTDLPQMPQFTAEQAAATVKGLLAQLSCRRGNTADGYALTVDYREASVTADFACGEGTAALSGVTVVYGGTTISVQIATTPLTFTDIDKTADFVDVTEVAQLFAQPVADLLQFRSFGSDNIEMNVTLGGKTYVVNGSFARDGEGTMRFKATLLDGKLGIADVDVIVVGGNVYLTVNGVKAAFKVPDVGGNVDFSAVMEQLAANKQAEQLLSAYPEAAELIDQIGKVASAFARFDVSDTNFGAMFASLRFENGELALGVNASAFELGNFTLTLGLDDGKLAVGLRDFALASVKLQSVSATLYGGADEIQKPSSDDYVISLAINGFGADIDLVADLYNMDVWATVTFRRDPVEGIHVNETAQLRYVNGNLYVNFNNVKLVFASKELGKAVSRLVGLLSTGESALPQLDDVLSRLVFDLVGESHAISYNGEGFDVQVNFKQASDKLFFDGITADVGGQRVTVQMQEASFDKLETDGDYVFADGNLLLDKLADILQTVKQADGLSAQFDLNLTLNGSSYIAHVGLTYNSGLEVSFVLADSAEQLIAEGKLIYVKDVLYIDVNGVKQAVALDGKENDGEPFRLADLKTALKEYLGIHDVLDEVIRFVNALPDKLTDETNVPTISALIGGLTLDEQNNVVLTLAASKLGLTGDVAITVGTDDKLQYVTFGTGEVRLGDALSLSAEGTLKPCGDPVTAPDPSDYVTELNVELFVDIRSDEQAAVALSDDGKLKITVGLRLDLFNDRVFGTAGFNGNSVTFELRLNSGNLFVVLGGVNGGSKLKFNINTDIDEIRTALAELGLTLPELNLGGDAVTTVKSLLDGIGYSRTQNGYALSLALDGISVGVGFNVEDGGVSLGDISVNGGGFDVNARQTAKNDANKGLPDAEKHLDEYLSAADTLGELLPAVAALTKCDSFAVDFDGVVTLGGKTYDLVASVNVVGSNAYIKIESLLYDGKRVTLIKDGQLWIMGNVLYVDIGGIKVKVNLAGSGDADSPAAVSNDALGGTLNGLRGYNDYLDKLLNLVESVASTDFLSCNFTDMIHISKEKGAYKLTVNGGLWNVSEFTATLSVLGSKPDGLQLSVSDFVYGDIAFDCNKLSVTNLGSITAPPENDDWTTNLDISVEDGTDITNTIHLRLDLIEMMLYVKIESQDAHEGAVDTTMYELYVKYDITANKLWLSNRGDANVSVDINDISSIVAEINDVVNKVAKEQHNFELPNLFQGGFNLKDIFDTLEFVHDSQKNGIGITFDAMGFSIEALVGDNAFSADIDVRSIFEDTDLHVAGASDSVHRAFADEMDSRISGGKVNYVAVDEVFDYLFYGPNGNLDGSKDNNGVMYDLVETNAWRFDFRGDANNDKHSNVIIDSTDSAGNLVTDKYRIAPGSYIVFAFNKSDTSFSMNQLLHTFGESKDDGYRDLFILLNTLQLRAKLTLQKYNSATKAYSDMLYLDIALLRYAGGGTADSAKARLYISYDTSHADGRSGELNATLSLDALDDVISLKDALDNVLGGAITNLVTKISDMIAEMKNNTPKMQLGRLARLFSAVTYGGDGNNFGITVNGKALSDKLGTIDLNVSAYNGTQGSNVAAAERRGRGLTVNELAFAYGGLSLELVNVDVSASTYETVEGTEGTQSRTYDYVTYGINGYRADHGTSVTKAVNNVEANSAYDKTNDHGYNMSKFMNFDSLYELAASLVITAGNEDTNGRRSFEISGTLHVDILSLYNVDIDLKMYADIDEHGDSYFAVRLVRPDKTVFDDKGGYSYLTFTTNDGNGNPVFNIYRDSRLNNRCPQCGSTNVEYRYDFTFKYNCKDCGAQKISPVDGKLDSDFDMKGAYSETNIAPGEFLDNLIQNKKYLFELLNFGSTIENLIVDQINNPDAKVFGVDYGIEDILDTGESYNYGDATDNDGKAVAGHKQFQIKANLSPISSALGTLDVKIHHSGDFNNLMKWNPATGKYEYDNDKLAAIKLDRLCGGLNIISIVHINFDLQHSTPGYGTARYFTSDLSQLWKDSAAWTTPHLL